MTARRRFTVLDLATGAFVAVVILIAVAIQIAGPAEPIPMHFNAEGQADRYGDRSELVNILLLMAAMAAALSLPMGWYARRTDDPARARGLAMGQLVTLITISATTAFMLTLILGTAYGGFEPGPGWIMAGVGALLAATGALLGRVAPNPIVGVRTPWSYKSRLAWERSNRLAGRLLFWIGLVAMIASPFAPQPFGVLALIGSVFIAVLWSAVESWRVWRDDPDRQSF